MPRKYQNWAELPDEKKIIAIKRELELDTHNATTKDDLIDMLQFLWDQFELQEV